MTGFASIVSPVAYFHHQRTAPPNRDSQTQRGQSESVLSFDSWDAARAPVTRVIVNRKGSLRLHIIHLLPQTLHRRSSGVERQEKFSQSRLAFQTRERQTHSLGGRQTGRRELLSGVDLRCADRSPAFLAGSSNYRLPSTASSQLAYRDEAA